MVRTIDQGSLDIDDRIASDHTLVEGILQTIDRRLDEFLRNCTAGDGFSDFNTLSRVGFHMEDDMTILTMTTRLLDVLTFAIGFAFDGFTICDLRSTDFASNAEVILQTSDVDIELQFADTGDDALTSFLIGIIMESRIFFCELDQGSSHLILVALLERLDSFGNNRFSELDSFQRDTRIVFTD